MSEYQVVFGDYLKDLINWGFKSIKRFCIMYYLDRKEINQILNGEIIIRDELVDLFNQIFPGLKVSFIQKFNLIRKEQKCKIRKG